MIAYLVTAAHRYTIDTFLDTWGRELRPRFQVVTYEELFAGAPLRAGTVIFTDLERLDAGERAAADAIWQELAALPARPRLLNRPAAVLTRLHFLTELHAAGVNDFRAVPLREARHGLRLPVFIRHKDEHWALPTLYRNPRALEREIARAYVVGRLDERLAVEFCDTVDADGVYRKYSAFVLDGRILPRHLVFDRHWYIKQPQLLDDRKVAEEQAYLETNPHAAELRAAAALGSYEYGRIDYGVRDGRIQVWEVNTNPMVMLEPGEYQAAHVPAQEWFRSRIAEELARLDGDADVDFAWSGGAPARAAAVRSPRRRPRVLQVGGRLAARALATAAAPLILARLEPEPAPPRADSRS